jgi:galactose mutarotase-like enzyme
MRAAIKAWKSAVTDRQSYPTIAPENPRCQGAVGFVGDNVWNPLPELLQSSLLPTEDSAPSWSIALVHSVTPLASATDALAVNATVYEPETGRMLEVSSTQLGLQFYTGNFLDGTITGQHGCAYEQRSGICIEPQHFPESPNHPEFPTTVLKPGQTYQHTIVYRFKSKIRHS